MEARRELPKEKKRINTPMGDGRVISVSPLLRRILVDLGEDGMKEFTLEELQNQNEMKEPSQNEKHADETNKKNRPNQRYSSRRKRKRRS
jgi:hypothetical protein